MPGSRLPLQFAPAITAHVPDLLARIELTRLTAMAVSMGGDPAKVIEASIERSGYTWCWLDDAGPVALGGVEPIAAMPNTGYAWQIVSSDLALHKRGYLEAWRAQMPAIFAAYAKVYALIEADNDAALRHVCRLGGTVGATVMNGTIPMRLCERAA